MINCCGLSEPGQSWQKGYYFVFSIFSDRVNDGKFTQKTFMGLRENEREREKKRERERERDGQTDRDRDREGQRPRDRHRETETEKQRQRNGDRNTETVILRDSETDR